MIDLLNENSKYKFLSKVDGGTRSYSVVNKITDLTVIATFDVEVAKRVFEELSSLLVAQTRLNKTKE